MTVTVAKVARRLPCADTPQSCVMRGGKRLACPAALHNSYAALHNEDACDDRTTLPSRFMDLGPCPLKLWQRGTTLIRYTSSHVLGGQDSSAFLICCHQRLGGYQGESGDVQVGTSVADSWFRRFSPSLWPCCFWCRPQPSRPRRAPTNSAIVIDVASGQVLLQSNADAQTYPASLTKMMTLYLLFEALKKGTVTLDQPLPVSANAASMPPTNLALVAGDTITVRTAIQGMIIRSANDVAVVVAEGLSGSVDAFAPRMNAKAVALGMTHTVFRNPNGLPDLEQHTTARDIATLAHRAASRFSAVLFLFHPGAVHLSRPGLCHAQPLHAALSRRRWAEDRLHQQIRAIISRPPPCITAGAWSA